MSFQKKKMLTLGEPRQPHSYDFNGRIRRMFESSSHHPLIPDGPVNRRLGSRANRSVFAVYVENRELTDPAEIEQALRFGEYIKNGAHMMTAHLSRLLLLIDSLYVRIALVCYAALHGKWAIIIETLALYSLRKYRYLKRRYDTSSSDP